jgi:hypothetical protein
MNRPFSNADFGFFASSFALKLTWERGGQKVSLPDFFGGLYISKYEKFLRYFKDWDRLNAIMEEDCRVRQPLLFYWFEMYEVFKKSESNPYLDVPALYDADVSRLLQRASEMSKEADSQGTKIVRVEVVLLAIFDFQGISVCQKLAGCGLQKSKLAEAAS